jgi:hypothetical protein
MKVDGRCHCGAISYEADVDPDTTSICHCTDCQTLSGSAYRVVVRTLAQTFVLHGTPTIYIKTAESGRKRAHSFCGVCGSPVYSTDVEPNPSIYSLRVGTLRQRHALTPRRQIWCASSVPWAMGIESLAKLERQ